MSQMHLVMLNQLSTCIQSPAFSYRAAESLGMSLEWQVDGWNKVGGTGKEGTWLQSGRWEIFQGVFRLSVLMLLT